MKDWLGQNEHNGCNVSLTSCKYASQYYYEKVSFVKRYERYIYIYIYIYNGKSYLLGKQKWYIEKELYYSKTEAGQSK